MKSNFIFRRVFALIRNFIAKFREKKNESNMRNTTLNNPVTFKLPMIVAVI